MHALIAAIHGILTTQTDPSWPDKFDAWMFSRDPEVKVLKKEYRAGPFPRWNCWVKDPLLARSLANELELFAKLRVQSPPSDNVGPWTLDFGLPLPPLWFVAHSNGAVIALLAAQRLIQRGYKIGGIILTGAACEADLARNRVLDWYTRLQLGAAIAYSSPDDHVLAGDSRVEATFWGKLRDWCWGKLLWPYGCLGRTGWLCHGQPLAPENTPQLIFTRWFPGGHSAYFTPENLEATFEQIYRDITSCSHITL